jgi:hypothetical protein
MPIPNDIKHHVRRRRSSPAPPKQRIYVKPISLEEALEAAAEGIFYTADHGNQRRRVVAQVRNM